MEKQSIDDAKVEAMIDKLRLTDPELLCQSGNKITRVCNDSSCKNALRCCDQFCKQCGLDVHLSCSSFDLKALTKILNNRILDHKEMVSSILSFYNKLMATIEDSKRVLIEYQVPNLPLSAQIIINQIYEKKEYKLISGREGMALLNIMKEISSTSKKEMASLVNSNFRKPMEKIIEDITELKLSLLQRFTSTIDSKILAGKDSATKLDLQFISQALGQYRKIELIFRASEHNFKAAAFHQKCGEADNTLTLIKTEFGKTLAAFTPYKWHSVKDGQSVSNPAGGTFILSLDQRQKLVPKDTSQLIRNESNKGPIFGDGSGLWIYDECNIKNGSIFRVSNYNTVDSKYKNDQAAWTVLTGATKDPKFKVVEYEVFHVIR